MKTLERRIEALEEKFQESGERVWLVFLPDTTFEKAKSNYEKRLGCAVTDEEFKRVLPSLGKLILDICERDGVTRRNDWIAAYQENP